MPPENLTFDLAATFTWGLPLLAVLLGASAWTLARQGVEPRRRAALLTLRGLGLLTVVVLLARPVAVRQHDPEERHSVTVLLDHSKSMSLVEAGATRYERARTLLEERLVPELKRRGLGLDAYLFAEHAFPAASAARLNARVDGRRTDLGGAVVHALKSAATPPIAVFALTDGAANLSEHNRSALLGLVDRGIPFVGLGTGDDEGVLSLSLDRLSAPPEVPPRETFKLTAHLQAVGGGEMPAFDLVLVRRPLGKNEATESIAQVRRVAAGRGSRLWTESFELAEAEEGIYEYSVELQAPVSDELVTVATRASVPVTVTSSESFRVLFVQGALTWNFKFIGRALRSDPSIRLTGLSRTSEHSVFRQNVESAGELLGGFPDELPEIAPYRVVVLSDLGPADLTPAQQETLARFVGELGGGLLMIGGTLTFDPSWQGSRLEELLPVTFDPASDVRLDRAFRLELSDEALRHPVFHLGKEGDGGVWQSLPAFDQYGRVLDKKPGAVVWARHSQDVGPHGPRILMASQYYGAGLSAMISVQSLWRWRLAKDLDPAHFDRFWKQLLRFLGQSGSQEVSVQLADQETGPGMEMRLFVERRPRPGAADTDDGPRTYTVRVEDPGHAAILTRELTLRPLRPVEIAFRTEDEGVYAVQVLNAEGVQLAARPIEVREVDREMARTGRDLENLRQWAGLSQGLALPLEECRDVGDLLDDVLRRAEVLQRQQEERRPLGVNGWVLAWLLACLGGEWVLRKRWGLR